MRYEKPAPKLSTGFKVWLAFCATIGLGVTGVGVWAVIKLVVWITSR